VHRDWALEMMLKLANAREQEPKSYLGLVDERLDDLGMQLMELKQSGVISNRGLNRGLSQISSLRSSLEYATSAVDVRSAFSQIDDLRSLVDEATAILKARESSQEES